jgi:hypothetical protein
VPKYDLEALWDEHCRCEFETRDVDATMATMIDAPYVNHIPTMTGGVGHDQLKRFYKYHFIGANPPDTKLVPAWVREQRKARATVALVFRILPFSSAYVRVAACSRPRHPCGEVS